MDSRNMLQIEWEMMDKSRFFGLSVVNSVILRSILYPLTVIKTRLQIQKQNTYYRGTFDAFGKIVQREGFGGLYKGFWINTMQVVSGIGYIMTYEKVRHLLLTKAQITDSKLRGLIAGGCSSVVSQTIITPFDVISQHMMVIGNTRTSPGPSSSGSVANSKIAANNLGQQFNGFSSGAGGANGKFNGFANPLQIDRSQISRPGRLALAIVRELYRRDGVRGFYRGYFASLNTYVPSSALWWMFYPLYSDIILISVPRDWLTISGCTMVVQCAAGSCSGITVAVLTNPLDVLRANIQVQRIDSFSVACRQLWNEEHFNIFRKGLSARVTQSCISSALIVIGYETLKRWSVSKEYKDKIKW